MQGPALQQMNPDMRLFCACTAFPMTAWQLRASSPSRRTANLVARLREEYPGFFALCGRVRGCTRVHMAYLPPLSRHSADNGSC